MTVPVIISLDTGGQHRNLITDGRLVQCLDCGEWHTDRQALASLPCEPDEEDDE